MAYSINRRLSDLIRSDGTIDTSKILDATIATADIANDAITADKIVDNIALAGNITTTGTLAPVGVLTANAGVVVDNITIDGTQIDLSSGDLTLDVAGDIILDAGGQNWYFDDDGTRVFSISQVSSDVYLGSEVSDKDIFIRVNDGGSTITALTIDGSDAGTATFNHDVNVGGDLTVTGNFQVDGTTTTLNTATLNVEDKNIILNYGSGDTSSTANGSGITIQDAVSSSSDASILWDSAADRFNFSDDIGWVTSNNLIKADLSSGGTTRTAEILVYNGSTGALEFKTNNASTGGIGFYTQGAKRMEVGRDSTVHIGDSQTVSGTPKLHVSSSTNDNWVARVVHTGTSVNYGLSIDTSAGAANTAGAFAVYTPNSGVPMYINNNGNVGIGVAAGIDEKLHVEEGNIKIEAGQNANTRGLIIAHTGQTGNLTKLEQNSTNSYGMLSTTQRALRIAAGTDGSTGTSEKLSFHTNGSRAMTIDTSQRVGIGTDSPGSALHISGGNNLAAQIRFTNTAPSPDNDWTIGSYYNDQGLYFRSNDNATNVMVMKDDGKVGIGLSNPGHPLAVYSAGSYYLSFDRGNSTPGGTDPWLGLFNNVDIASATYGWGWYDSSSDGSLQLWNKNNSTTGYDVMTFMRGGDVGIGTDSPGVKLDITSTAQNVLRLDTTNSDGPLQIFRNNGTVRGYIGNAEGILGKGVTNFGMRAQAALYFGTGGNNTAMTIDTSQRVGIGTASPTTSRLQVHDSKGSAGTAWTAVGPGNIACITVANESSTDNTMAGVFLATGTSPNIRGGMLMNFTDTDNESTLHLATTDSSGNTRNRLTIAGDGTATFSAGANLSGNLSMMSNVVYANQVYVHDRLGHLNDVNTYIDFTSDDNITMAAGGDKLYIKPDTGTNCTVVSVGNNADRLAGDFRVHTANTSGGTCTSTGSFQEYRNVCTNHGSGSANYWHIKTNFKCTNNIMFVARMHGYAYGSSGQIIDVQRSGYAYAGSGGTIINSGTVNNGQGSFTLDVYKASDDYVCFKGYLVGGYYTGTSFDIKFPSPTGYNWNFQVVSQVYNTVSGNHY